MFHSSWLELVLSNQIAIFPRSISTTTEDHGRWWRSRFSESDLFYFFSSIANGLV